MSEFEPIRRYYTTQNAPNGDVLDFIINHERSKRFDRRGDAISHGFDLWGHDDFNIAVWDDDLLVSWDWMDEPVENSAGLVEVDRMLRHG